MFTGLIEDIGTIRARTPRGADVTLEISTQAIDVSTLALGESVAVNGVCLTVTSAAGGGFSADASVETLASSALGRLRVGDRVHLERALRLGDRLGGHIVQGHVDGTGRLARRSPAGRAWDLWIEAPAALLAELIPKGSVAVDGVSLTVNEVDGREFRLTIIPHTEDKTLLLTLPVGAAVNLETDVIGKYVRRAVGANTPSTLRDTLARFGYTPPE
ncbi:MAG: riboflavin synthase [Myxococcales bacterium]|nr:riboflavin synthase [Myxococcales bacterium]MCB9519293.1 riboflavin synthase [Myxococcales bacterium]MCB9530737.1 riboflavin synthase [Myxococcales bacterium]MCB9533369.1 riboflavin synthase [Myxococcales bacterium]